MVVVGFKTSKLCCFMLLFRSINILGLFVLEWRDRHFAAEPSWPADTSSQQLSAVRQDFLLQSLDWGGNDRRNVLWRNFRCRGLRQMEEINEDQYFWQQNKLDSWILNSFNRDSVWEYDSRWLLKSPHRNSLAFQLIHLEYLFPWVSALVTSLGSLSPLYHRLLRYYGLW